ncbi:MAG: hypothetical protein AB8B63_07845 [Granulosicoccus sp.]
MTALFNSTILLFALSALVACSSHADDSSESDDAGAASIVRTWGVVEVDSSDGVVGPFAYFARFSQGIPTARLLAELDAGADDCTVENYVFGETSQIKSELPDFGAAYSFIGAGDVINLARSGESYATLSKLTSGSTMFYVPVKSGAGLVVPAPDGLTASIPGESDGFPAVSEVFLPDRVPMMISSPAEGDAVTPTTEFAWTPSSGDAVVSFTSVWVDVHSGGADTTRVECTLVDDGRFLFPAAIQSQMGLGFNSDEFSLSRKEYRVDSLGDNIILIVSNTSD